MRDDDIIGLVVALVVDGGGPDGLYRAGRAGSDDCEAQEQIAALDVVCNPPAGTAHHADRHGLLVAP